jgi:nucleotide-binding universal stress UspA family protein
MKKSVLACIGYSDISQDVVRVADHWALRMHADLHLIHVRDPSPYVPETPESFETFVQRLDLKNKPRIYTPAGKAEHTIMALAKEVDADLVVIAAHEHTFIGRLFVGSTSNYVAHHAPCPVLVVRREDSELNGIIVPVDFTDINHEVIKDADQLARETGQPLYFIHVAPNTKMFMSWGLDEEGMPDITTESNEHQETILKLKMENLIADLCVRAPHEEIISKGTPYEEILKLQEVVGAGLIMAAEHSTNALESFLLGGNTRHLLNQAKCSVLVHRKKEDAEPPETEKPHSLSEIVI